MTAATITPEQAADHPSTIALLEQHPTPAMRRHAAAAAAAKRRADLVLYRALLIERDGKAPRLERILARDQLLGELTLIAAMTDPTAAAVPDPAPPYLYPTPPWWPHLLGRLEATMHVTAAEVLSARRAAGIVRARHVAAGVARERGLTLPHIGALLGRHHSTVMASLAAVDRDADLTILVHALAQEPTP